MAFSKELFRKQYLENGKDNLESQLPHLRLLADIYISSAEDSRNWLDFIKVGVTMSSQELQYSLSIYSSTELTACMSHS